MSAFAARVVIIFVTLAFFAKRVAAQNADGPSPYGAGHAPDVIVNATLINSYPAYEGSEPPELTEADDNDTLNAAAIGPNRRAAQDFYLRVMPLGASITQGIASSDGNGDRKWIRSQLRWKGWKVNMVGSKQDGTMADKTSCSGFSYPI